MKSHVSPMGNERTVPMFMGQLSDRTGLTIDLSLPSNMCVLGSPHGARSGWTRGLLAQLIDVDHVSVRGCDPFSVSMEPWTTRARYNDITAGTKPHNAETTLLYAAAELDFRLEELDTNSRNSFSPLDYTKDFPLLLVVLEDYAELLDICAQHDAKAIETGSEPLTPTIRALVHKLVTEGSRAGIRVWITTEKADAGFLTRSIMASMHLRATFGLQDPDAIKLFHPGGVVKPRRFMGGPSGARAHWSTNGPAQPLYAFTLGLSEYSRAVRA